MAGAAGAPGKDTPQATFALRSVDGMIYYLGEFVRWQIDNEPPPLVPFGPRDEPSILFQVDINPGPGAGERIEVEFLGQRFAVRRRGDKADRTLTVLSLLSQLFSLYREGKELPKTTAVQVVGTP